MLYIYGFIILLHIFFMLPADSAHIQEVLPDFNKLWNFGKPQETEKKFRELLPSAESAGNPSYLAQLLSQIARTLSLQAKFKETHEILDRVEKMLTPDLKLARVRYLLERGRTFNSSDQQDKALPLFIEAYELGAAIKEMKYAIDAVHMIAIAKKDPKDQIEWNLKGIEMAQADRNSQSWLHALYNNIGESYLLTKEYKTAASYFHKLAELQKENGGEADIYTLKDEAKAIRLSGNPNEALAIIEPIFQKLISEKQDNGWIREEIAENYYALEKKAEAKLHFIKAFELLSKDEYCIQYEQDKLKHLKEMVE